MKKYITREYLISHPNEIFVFGDNTIRKGYGGGAKLRNLPNTYGFITKKYPNYYDYSYYRLNEYRSVLKKEIEKLTSVIEANPNKKFLISKLGGGLANKYGIWRIIKPELIKLKEKFGDRIELLF